MANNFEIAFDVVGLIPDDTNTPERKFAQDRTYWAFDDSTDEFVYTPSFEMPAAYTGSGTLKIDLLIGGAGTSGNIGFDVAVEAITAADAVDMTGASSWDTDNTANTAAPGTAGYLAKLTITLTNKDSVAAGDIMRLRINRDAATASDMTGDAYLWGVTVYEEA